MTMNRFKNTVVGISFFLAGMVVHVPAKASPLHVAALKGDVELAEMLIENGADVDERDVNGFTPLLLAIQEGHNQLAKVLIANGADVTASAVGDSGGESYPLDLSIVLDNREVDSPLLDNGAQR